MSIPYKQFIHPYDKAAMDAMRAIPGFDAVFKKLVQYIDEKSFYVNAKASLIQVTPKQYGWLYNILVRVCDKLQIDVPDFYIGCDGELSSYSYGDKRVMLIVDAGCFWAFSEDEIESVIVHECGHIVCRHAFYNALADIIVGDDNVGGLITAAIHKALKGAASYWRKCANFSADRVMTYYYRSADPVVEMCMKMARSSIIPGKIDKEEFIKQGMLHKELLKQSNYNKILNMFNPIKPNNPFLVLRAANAIEFHESFDYDKFDKETLQENIKKITVGSTEKHHLEITFNFAKEKGIQFLASSLRKVVNKESLKIEIQGVPIEVKEGGKWERDLNHGKYNMLFKIYACREEYALYLTRDTRLRIEWSDKEDRLFINEEPFDASADINPDQKD